MKECIDILRRRDFKALFIEPSNNLFIQMFRYLFVGGGAFIVDAGSLYVLYLLGMDKFIATACGFILGLIVNFALSKLLVFKKEDAKVGSVVEFIAYGAIGLIGLGLTELLIYFFTDILPLHILLAKIFAAAIVLIWNFAARKITLYKKPSEA